MSKSRDLAALLDSSGDVVAGALDNAGGGGLTNFTESVNTTSPNDTTPVVSLQASNSATNVDVALILKGTGALITAVPDDTSTGGAKRGEYAIDLQTQRDHQHEVAQGDKSTAIGQRCKIGSNSYESVAVGYRCEANSARATAMGVQSSASGDYATSVGRYCTANGWYSSAFGWTARANSSNSVAIGYDVLASSSSAVALGNNLQATGNKSTAVGWGSRAQATRATTVGAGTYANSTESSSFGCYVVNDGAYSATVGYRVNNTVDGVAELGIWDSSTVRGGSVRVHDSGYVGVSLPNTSTALTDGGTTHGSEADLSLMRESYSLRRNGNEILVDVNIAGTIKTLSLGTAT